jgi:hypothetical protein
MSLISPILEQTQGKISFAIDDVEPAQKPLSSETAKLQLENGLDNSILAFSVQSKGFYSQKLVGQCMKIPIASGSCLIGFNRSI